VIRDPGVLLDPGLVRPPGTRPPTEEPGPAWSTRFTLGRPGPVNVRLVIEGDAPRCGGRFQRVEQVSILAG
jgi:hypothetical protein